MCYNNNGDDMRKIKKKAVTTTIAVIIVLIGVIIGVKKIVDVVNYHKTYEYKLLQLGYSIDETKKIDKLEDKTKDYILTLKYDKDLSKIISEKYFLEKNLKSYIEYKKENDKSTSDIVAIVNVNANNDWYTNTKKSDTKKGELMLTNKFYSLDSSYDSTDMVSISNQYSFGSNQMVTEKTLDAFITMFNDAKKENLTLVINSSFRSYEDQEEIYDYYKKTKGEAYADSIAAHPGFSEHQTGMAIDIQTYGSTAATFEEFDEFKWLKENAHKYGFILRYPKDKEYLTGYNYESWHFRYVGVEAATYIYENNITFDEYYAYFVE